MFCNFIFVFYFLNLGTKIYEILLTKTLNTAFSICNSLKIENFQPQRVVSMKFSPHIDSPGLLIDNNFKTLTINNDTLGFKKKYKIFQIRTGKIIFSL